jgi:hypothetical protein
MRRSSTHSIRRRQVERAVGPCKWDRTNKTLYELCRQCPTHTDTGAILAKMQIIGRVYAAAIERRKNRKDEETTDSFYFLKVAPAIKRSKLDEWINEAKATNPNSDEAFAVMVKVHKRTTKLFSKISGLNKRSLASKYLHFHVPRLFYILDSRAEKAIGKFQGRIGKASLPPISGDPKYRVFAAKYASLKSRCEAEFGISLSPRKLDNLLLSVTS